MNQKGRNGWDGLSLPFSDFHLSPALFCFSFLSSLLQLPLYFSISTHPPPLYTHPCITTYIYIPFCFLHTLIYNSSFTLHSSLHLSPLLHPRRATSTPPPPAFLFLFETWSPQLVSYPRNHFQSPLSTTRIKDTTLYPHYATGISVTIRGPRPRIPWPTTHHYPQTRSRPPPTTHQSLSPLSPHPCHRRPSSLPSVQIGRKRNTTPSTQQASLQARALIVPHSYIPALSQSLLPPRLHHHSRRVAQKAHQSP